MEQKIDIAVIGECLIELSANGTLADTSTLNKYFGGDTVTTAVAIARITVAGVARKRILRTATVVVAQKRY